MKTRQIKRITQYSALTAAFFSAGERINAQVVYTDLDPDIIISDGSALEIDLDADGIVDVSMSNYLSFSSGEGACSSVYWTTYQSVVLSGFDAVLNNLSAPVSFGVDALIEGDPISIAGNWNPIGWLRLYEGYSSYSTGCWWGDGSESNSFVGAWHNIPNGFIGLRFQIDGETHYGWVNVSSVPWAGGEGIQTFTVKGYAYEATPGFPIHAGDMGGCLPPEPIGTASITATSAKAKWESVGSADYYEIQYHPVGAALWHTKIVDAPKTFRKINSLDCETDYEWHVRTVCVDGTISDYSPMQNFSTTSCRMGNENLIEEENVTIISNSNHVAVHIDEDIVSETNFVVYDQLGREVFRQRITSENSDFYLEIPTGIYFTSIQSQEINITKQIVIQN